MLFMRRDIFVLDKVYGLCYNCFPLNFSIFFVACVLCAEFMNSFGTGDVETLDVICGLL